MSKKVASWNKQMPYLINIMKFKHKKMKLFKIWQVYKIVINKMNPNNPQ